MAGVAPLLEKLEPMAMMEEGGLQRASIAIKLLAHKSATDPSVGGGILEARGVRILLQVSSCGSGFLFICRPKLALTGVGQPGGRAGV